MSAGVTVELDERKLRQKVDKRCVPVQKMLDAQVLKDSNFYCPVDSGDLKNSAITTSVIGSGKLEWAEPYAHAQYYGYPKKRKEYNANATSKWFETAKQRRIKVWEKIANEEYQRGN